MRTVKLSNKQVHGISETLLRRWWSLGLPPDPEAYEQFNQVQYKRFIMVIHRKKYTSTVDTIGPRSKFYTSLKNKMKTRKEKTK